MGLFDIFKKTNEGYERSFNANADTYYKAINRYNTQDYNTAFRLFSKAAKGYHMSARYMLALCYENGHGTEKDFKKAYDIYSRVVNDYEQNKGNFYFDRYCLNIFGVSCSKYRIGLFYMWGMVVPQDVGKAIEIFSRMDRKFDHNEVVFLSCRELYANYSHGSNGFPKDYNLAHKWALKTLAEYEDFTLPDSTATENFKNAYSQSHHWALQFVAYNLENGRGTKKDLDAGTEYRRRAGLIYKDSNDTYWAGRGYEQLGRKEDARFMYNQVLKFDNDEEFRQKAIQRLDKMDNEEKEEIRAKQKRAVDKFWNEVNSNTSRSALANACQLYIRGEYDVYYSHNGETKPYTVTVTPDIEKAIEYMVQAITPDIVDKTPLTGAMTLTYDPLAVQDRSEAEIYEEYVRVRMKEKRGHSFDEVLSDYLTLSSSMHMESIFRAGQIYSQVMGESQLAEDMFNIARKNGRPVYNRYSEPTLGLVELMKMRDPEAILDLYRIYDSKPVHLKISIRLALLDMAIWIYEKRAEAGDPEAIYNLAELKHKQHKNGMIYLLDASAKYYGKALADISSDLFSKISSPEESEKMRKLADDAGAMLPAYISYCNNKEIIEAVETLMKQEMESMSSEELEKRTRFIRLYDFMKLKIPFYDDEMKRMIEDGTVDGLYDKQLAEMIKKLADRAPDLSGLNEETIEALKTSFRELFDL